MKGILRTLLVIVILGAAIGGALFFYQSQNSADGTLFADETVSATPALTNKADERGVILALAIDLDHDDKLDHSTLEKGDDGFLVIKASAKSIKDVTQVGSEQLFVFNGVDSIIQHDKNFDGWINELDPIFAELEIAHLKRFAAEQRIQTLREAGIHALYFSESYLAELRAGKEAVIGEEVGYAVMIDSSQRKIRVVGLPLSILEPQ